MNNDILGGQESSLFMLNIDKEIQSHLIESARWARFLAIVGFIGIGLLALASIFMLTAVHQVWPLGAAYNSGAYTGGSSSYIGSIVIIVWLVLASFPFLFLLRFANRTQSALRSNDQASLAAGMQNLKRYFRYLGIITILVLVFYAIIFLILGLSSLER